MSLHTTDYNIFCRYGYINQICKHTIKQVSNIEHNIKKASKPSQTHVPWTVLDWIECYCVALCFVIYCVLYYFVAISYSIGFSFVFHCISCHPFHLLSCCTCATLIADCEAFRQRHPVTGYEHYRELVKRVAAGEAAVLTAERPLILAMTSGTSGQSSMLLSTKDTNTEFFLQVGFPSDQGQGSRVFLTRLEFGIAWWEITVWRQLVENLC